MSGLGGIVEEFKHASPGGKALAITAVIAVAGLGIYTASVKKSSSNATSLLPIGVSGDTSSISQPTTSTTDTTSPVSALMGIVRGNRTGDKYDQSHKGIPLRSAIDSSSSDLVDIPWGSQLSIIGSPIYGKTSPQGTSVWYKVSYGGQTGYVSAFDLPNVFPFQNYLNGGNPPKMQASMIGGIVPAPTVHSA